MGALFVSMGLHLVHAFSIPSLVFDIGSLTTTYDTYLHCI